MKPIVYLCRIYTYLVLRHKNERKNETYNYKVLGYRARLINYTNIYPRHCKDTQYTLNNDKRTYRDVMPKTNKK